MLQFHAEHITWVSGTGRILVALQFVGTDINLDNYCSVI